MTETTYIAMWSGPRNISTTMMRSFENRGDTDVIDEPFCASYLKRTGANHPYREQTLDAQPNTYNQAVSWALQPNKGGQLIKFQKHIAYHVEPAANFDWLLKTKCFLLIRDPRLMIASYANKSDDVEPIARSFQIERLIADFLDQNQRSCPIVDASDILRNPESMLRKLCASLAISFDPAMLSWPSGRRPSDGAWAPHWYSAVESSTGFRPYTNKTVNLSPGLEAIAAGCMDDYNTLFERRLVI